VTAAAGVVEHATCLGCGCACDDIVVRTEGDRIVDAERACPLGRAWFGDGRVPVRAVVRGGDASAADALDAAAALLAGAARPLVYLAPELSCEAQRAGVAVADLLRAALDTVTSATAMPSLLAAQERGRAGATLGEVRNRADVLVFWALDPAERYPRYRERYAPELPGTHLAAGRAARRVVAVDVGAARGPADADLRVAVERGDEVALLTALRAIALGGDERAAGRVGAAWDAARELAPVLAGARYLVIVHDAEPRDAAEGRAGRAGPLIALAQALNGPTRCALSTLRAGGNRSGADAVLTAHTGYPAAVDFARGFPRYLPGTGDAPARLARGEVDAALVLGDAARLPAAARAALAGVPCVLIGPRASESALGHAGVALDSGVAGIHEGGLAFRTDDVPLPLRPSLVGPPAAAALVAALADRVAAIGAGRAANQSAEEGGR
jgi:formylmethanofuran dehydrogenase subunit B